MKKEDFNEICEYLKTIIKGTEFENHVFCVGGCCRDEILKHEIKDIDLTVDIRNGGIKLSNWLYENGFLKIKPVVYPSYNTSQFRLGKFPRYELEAVQTRKEKYADRTNRNPETAFGTLKEDCMRRDFTINTIYKNISTGEYLDMTGRGIEDINNGFIKTPLDPFETFDDDPLRMLRCIRFASCYDFDVDDDVLSAIKKNADRMKIITKERIREELNKILSGNRPSYGMSLIINNGLLEYVFPNIRRYMKENKENLSCIEMEPAVCLNGVKPNSYRYMLSVIFVSVIDDYHNVITLMKDMKYSNDDVKLVTECYKTVKELEKHVYDFTMKLDKKWINRIKYNTDEHSFHCAFNVFYFKYGHVTCKEYLDYLRSKESDRYFIYKLPVNGNDIMKAISGLKPCVEVKNILNDLTEDYFLKNSYISKEKLIEKLKNYKIK
jgi:poly(A) polymerase